MLSLIYTECVLYRCGKWTQLCLALIKPIWTGKDERAIHTAKATGVGKGDIDCGMTSDIGYIIEVALGISLDLVNGRRNDLLIHYKSRDNRFNSTCCSLRMPNHRFSGANRNMISLFAEGRFVGSRLRCFVRRC